MKCVSEFFVRDFEPNHRYTFDKAPVGRPGSQLSNKFGGKTIPTYVGRPDGDCTYI